jgi:integrase
MRGHIKERSPGHWAIVIDVNDNGRRKRKWHSFVGNKRGAQAECNRLLAATQSGAINAAPARLTLAAFMERWLLHMVTQTSPATHYRYSSVVRSNIVPLLGGTALSRLQPEQIAQGLAKMMEGGLSPETTRFVRKVLRQACEQATRWNLIARNPCDAVDPPKVEKRRMTVLDEAGMASLLERARGSELYIPTLLAITCGLRRGEIAALRWKAVDLSTGRLHVVASTEQIGVNVREKETKSGKSRCVILPGVTIEELRQHKRQQAEHLLCFGVRQGDDRHVCTRADGSAWVPLVMTKAFGALLEGTGIGRLHDLRHSHATALLSAGVHLKVAAERLGHASIAITADLYSHVSDTMQSDAAARIDEGLRRALSRLR